MSWIVMSLRLLRRRCFIHVKKYLDVRRVQFESVLLVDHLVQYEVQILHTPEFVCFILSRLAYQVTGLWWTAHFYISQSYLLIINTQFTLYFLALYILMSLKLCNFYLINLSDNYKINILFWLYYLLALFFLNKIVLK